MKIIALALLCSVGLLRAEESPAGRYDHLSEMGHSYQYESEKFHLWLYWRSPVWFKGIQTDREIEMKPSDHLSCIRNGLYHEYYFSGPVKDRLRFDHKTYEYFLGPEENKMKRIIKGDLLKSEIFYLPQEGISYIVDYIHYLESHSEEKMWKTR